MTTVWHLAALPIIVTGILIGSVIWWTASVLAEGISQVRVLIRTAN